MDHPFRVQEQQPVEKSYDNSGSDRLRL
jgi:hypothetical protein